jgi:hypothetical protein
MTLLPAPAQAQNAGPTTAESSSVSAQEMDEAIRQVINRPEFTWRLPREQVETAESQTWSAFWDSVGDSIEKALDAVMRFLRKIADWIDRHFPEHEQGPLDTRDWLTPAQILLFAVLAAAASTLAILLFRLWKRRKQPHSEIVAQATPLSADILKEDTLADERPSEEWMDLARQFMEQGEWRLAIRAMFLACLAHLARRGHLTIAKHKSNREYLSELERRAHDLPIMLSAFTENTRTLEQIWYGNHSATTETIRVFQDNQNVIMKN